MKELNNLAFALHDISNKGIVVVEMSHDYHNASKENKIKALHNALDVIKQELMELSITN